MYWSVLFIMCRPFSPFFFLMFFSFSFLSFFKLLLLISCVFPFIKPFASKVKYALKLLRTTPFYFNELSLLIKFLFSREKKIFLLHFIHCIVRNLPFISICPFSYLSALVLINVSLKHAARPIQLSLQGFVWLLSPKTEMNLQQCRCVDYLRLLCNQHLWDPDLHP